ncbi:metal ABC transporter ATP-binding protein [Actinopolymorpha alba]|uniref:metal ABC transporter ATP-binding protein n=1 Tax=Actinopolymorpha alba TaxID=533267 RepID=UPI000375C32D|nr:ABC transporter ATP-binding protein [Actinopolymorpha alba]
MTSELSTATAPPAVRIRNGSVAYAGQRVLAGVELDIVPGDVVALLGPNGSGKSTLIRAILGLVPLTAGSLELFGIPAGRFRDRARIGYVPQRHTVGGGVPATVTEVVASGRLVRRRGGLRPWLGAADRASVAEAIETVGLTEKARAPISALSGGQQRRALIARALAGEPDLLVMDEPFAGVDLANQEILTKTLSALVAQGVTLLLVTHELGPVASLIRRTIVLDHGRVAYDGTPTESVLALFGGPDPDPHSPPSGSSDGTGTLGIIG